MVLLLGLPPLVSAGIFDDLSKEISDASKVVEKEANKVIDSAKELAASTGLADTQQSSSPQKITTSKSTENRELSCDQWEKKLQVYTQGDRGLLPYPDAEKEQVVKWAESYAEAKPLCEQFAEQVNIGSCMAGERNHKYLTTKIADFEAMYPDVAETAVSGKASNGSGSNKGKFIFSTQPITPDSMAGVTNTFSTGDYIYGLVQVKKAWKKLYGKNKNFYVRVDVKVDGKKSVNGKKIHAQFITIKSEDYANRDYLVFNVAPEADKIIVYSDPNLMYGQTTPVIKQGPNELSYHLGQLSPGKHTVSFEMQDYGKMFAEGEFTISGASYGHYASLHEQIAQGVVSDRTLPAAKLNNPTLEQEMEDLLLKAGWKNIYRLNIVDKDWWVMRASGGDSPVVGRYMDAVALTEDPKGKFYYKRCSFQQDKLLGGGFGELFISKQGEAVPVNKDNIDK